MLLIVDQPAACYVGLQLRASHTNATYNMCHSKPANCSENSMFCVPSNISQINQLAMWLETSKMQPALTGNLLGGALAGDMLQRMAAAEAAVSRGSQVGGYFTVGDYVDVTVFLALQVCVLTALLKRGTGRGHVADAAAARAAMSKDSQVGCNCC
jgi:hypothetical protein